MNPLKSSCYFPLHFRLEMHDSDLFLLILIKTATTLMGRYWSTQVWRHFSRYCSCYQPRRITDSSRRVRANMSGCVCVWIGVLCGLLCQCRWWEIHAGEECWEKRGTLSFSVLASEPESLISKNALRLGFNWLVFLMLGFQTQSTLHYVLSCISCVNTEDHRTHQSSYVWPIS